MRSVSWLPVFVTFFPMAMTLLIGYLERSSVKLRDFLVIATTVVTFAGVLAMLPAVMRGEVPTFELLEILPGLGFVGTFRVDLLSFCLTLISSFVWMLASIYSLSYMSHEHAQNRYYPTLTVTLGACLGIFTAGDFFTLFIFFELMSVISYVLVVHEETVEALKAGYKYIIVTIIGGLSLLLGVINTYEISGSLSLDSAGLITEPSGLALATYLAFLIGFGMKAGMFPLHVWLPDAHPVAPAPASALLSGIMLKTGAYGLFRVVFTVFSPEFLLSTGWIKIMAVLGIITILLGSAVALTQFELKRRLAYSSIGQMGYVLLGLSVLRETALVGAVFHIFSHAFMKSCLFLCAGAIIHRTGERDVRKMAGFGMRMPYTFGAFTVASLAMIGIPPLNGFLSKWSLALGALDGGHTVYVAVLLLSSLLNGLYYLPIIIIAFFGETAPLAKNEASPLMLWPIMILAGCCVVFGVSPFSILFRLSQLTANLLMNGGM